MSAGYYARNRDLVLEKAKAVYLANRDEVLAKRRARYAERAEVMRERDRVRRAANRERFSELARARYQRRRDEKLAANTRWRAKNVERVRANARRRDAMKAKSQIGPIDYTRVLVESSGLCGICCLPIDVTNPKNYHYDHIIALARGGTHTQDNIQLAHAKCNMRKWAKPLGTGMPAAMGAPGGMIQ